MRHEILVGAAERNIEADLREDEEPAVNLHRCVPIALPDDGGVAFVDHRPGPS
ncbi:hypothetical protein [Streptomyces sp. NPDC014623]|uniref:hypothetical protein n=1 Tax=Streptomyces sp. NPDC014623 TaxID=3364875 RepID=UPI0036FB45CC